MKIIVFSDTHNLTSAAEDIIKRNLSADLFVFLGDGENDLNSVKTQYYDKSFVAVSGNCDYYSRLPEVGEFSAMEKKIVFTHGHRYNVRYSLDALYYLAKERKADIMLFGHTHTRYHQIYDNIHFVNPGSAAIPRDSDPPSYALLTINDEDISVKHIDLI